MNARTLCGAFFAFTVCVLALRSQEPKLGRPAIPSVSETEQDKQPDKDKKQKDKDKAQPDKDKTPPDKKKDAAPPTDIFAPGTDNLGQIQQGFTPNMMGWIGPSYYAAQNVRVNGVQTTLSTTTMSTIYTFGDPVGNTTTTAPGGPVTHVTAQRILLVPIATRGAFEIGDNESPMPQDRVFLTYNNYTSVTGPQSGFNTPLVIPQTVTKTFPFPPSLPVGTVAVPTSSVSSTVITIPGAPSVTMNREVFGFERTFLDGRASVELRVPFLEQPSSFGGFNQDDVGDLTIVGKYAFYLDRSTGNVVSGGVAITAPTGPAIAVVDGNLRDTLLQPFVGYLWNFDTFYFQAFHSVVVPTDSRDVTILFNDAGMGYWFYKGDPNRFLSSIVPNVEVHVATPLDHRGAVDNLLVAPDVVAITAGVHFGIFRDATLSVGVTTPVTAPRIYGIESFVQLNWAF